MTEQLKDYLTLSEASKIFGMTEDYLRSLCSKGKITGAKKFGKLWIIPCSAIKPIHIPNPTPKPSDITDDNYEPHD